MENKLDSSAVHSRAPIRSADTAVVRAITHEDIEKYGKKNSDKPAVRSADISGSKSKSKAEAKAAAKDKPKEKSRVLPLFICFFFAVITLVLYAAINVYSVETDKVNRRVVVECGAPVSESLFFNQDITFPEYEECNLDFTGVNINIPQTIHFTITYLWTDMECELEIADSTPPKGTGIPQKLFAIDKLPDVNKCVKNIKDMTDVTVKWGNIPDYSAGGEFKAEALLTDACGNVGKVEVPLSVTCDNTPPVIEGTKDYSGFTGSTITYRDGVTVTDDYDKNPQLSIDTSQVNLNKAGKYKVIYTARDFSGNVATTEITVELTKKPKSYIEQEKVDKVAKKILNKITKSTMTPKEKALQIVWWCRYNIGYVAKDDATSRNRAAYNALTKRHATCYGYACAVREMLNLCGIENMLVKRSPFRHSVHYWNYIKIDGQWYHCDSTPRKGYRSYFFMYTTKELQSFYDNGWNGYNFKVKKYPASAKKSVQKTIDYANHRIKK